MDPRKPRRAIFEGLAAAAVALAAILASGPLWAQVTPTPAGALERAAALIQDREFDQAEAVLRELLAVDPANRRARELLAFALESRGDLDGEREVRSALASEFPTDASIQADYGRVLERSGKEREALAVYRRARDLSADRSAPELDAAIDRMTGRTAVEVGMPVMVMSDPDASASRAQAGVAVPLGSQNHLALLATHQAAEGSHNTNTTASDAFALSLVLRNRSGASMTVGPRVHVISPEGGAGGDTGIGGAIAGRVPLGRWFEADASGEIETPWDESAVTVLHGGRTTAAEGHLYAHLFSRRVLLQVGARRRRLSILAADPDSTDRPEARQDLLVGGADVVLWRKPGAAVRGEMLDDTLDAPAALSSAITLGYRRYAITTHTTPEFAAQIGLAPRGAVDEASLALTVASPRGHVGLDLRGGLGRDAARDAQMWRAEGALIFAPRASIRCELGYERATEFATGLTGRRRRGWLSFHVDL